VFQTKSEVLIMPGSGRTALEAGALSVIEPGDHVLVVGAGVFGVLMREIMGRVGAEMTEFPVEWGARLDLDRLAREAERLRPKAITLVHNETSTGTTYPAAEVGKIARATGSLFLLDTVSSIAGIDVRTDEWGVDLNMTGSQKCLAAPLGMSLVSVSPRAWEAMEQRKSKAHSYAYDLLRWREQWVPVSRGGKVPDGTARRQPVSIPTHLTEAMRVAVRLILEEGLPHRFRRHALAAQALRAGTAAMGLDMFPDPAILSITQFNAGSAHNIIPDEVDIVGTLRTLSEKSRFEARTAFERITTKLMRTRFKPCARNRRMVRTERRKAWAWPRTASCTRAVGPSREMDTRLIPLAASRRAAARSISVPLVVTFTFSPRATAASARSRKSRRRNTSPPEKCTLRHPSSASSSNTSRQRSEDSVSSRSVCQYLHITQRRLHRDVSLILASRSSGGGAPLSRLSASASRKAGVPISAGTLYTLSPRAARGRCRGRRGAPWPAACRRWRGRPSRAAPPRAPCLRGGACGSTLRADARPRRCGPGRPA